MTSYEEFDQNGDRLIDRFGEAYFFARRDEPYLNPDQEYKNQFAKQSLYSSLTPISARSYQEKKMTINQQLERTLNQMKTPTASQTGGMGGLGARIGITPTAAGGGNRLMMGTITPTSSQMNQLLKNNKN